jgi:hypothetical protein
MRSFLPTLSGKDYVKLFAILLITLEFIALYGLIRAYPTLHCLGYDVIEIAKNLLVEEVLIWLQECFSFF